MGYTSMRQNGTSVAISKKSTNSSNPVTSHIFGIPHISGYASVRSFGHDDVGCRSKGIGRR